MGRSSSVLWYADVHQTLTRGHAPSNAVLQKWEPYSSTMRWRRQRRYFLSDWPGDMSNGPGALWRSCLTVTVLCRSTWMTWRRRTSASSSASTSWRRGSSRSMRRAAKTCTARWVAAAPQGPRARSAECVSVRLRLTVNTAVLWCPLCVCWRSCPEEMGRVPCLFYWVAAGFAAGLNTNELFASSFVIRLSCTHRASL